MTMKKSTLFVIINQSNENRSTANRRISESGGDRV